MLLTHVDLIDKLLHYNSISNIMQSTSKRRPARCDIRQLQPCLCAAPIFIIYCYNNDCPKLPEWSLHTTIMPLLNLNTLNQPKDRISQKCLSRRRSLISPLHMIWFFKWQLHQYVLRTSDRFLSKFARFPLYRDSIYICTSQYKFD
jgi:hypothetical protein